MANRIPFVEGKTKFTKKVIPFNNVFNTPTDAINAYIAYIRTKAFTNPDIEKLKLHYKRLLHLYSIAIVAHPWYNFLYRARITKDNNIKSLLNPPSHLVTSMGRCNNVNESIFYCSNSYITSVLEIKPRAGDVVTVLMLQIDDTSKISNFVPAVPIAQSKLNENVMNCFVQSADKHVQGKLDLIDSLFTEIMTQEVQQSCEHLYQSSIALLQAYREHLKRPDCGLIYPSMASMKYGVNFALNPDWLNYIENPVYKAFRFEIVEETSTFNIVGRLVEVATTIDSLGFFEFRSAGQFDHYVRMDKDYYEKYERAFATQHSGKGLLEFRRFYPPPILPEPYNLVPLNKITTLYL